MSGDLRVCAYLGGREWGWGATCLALSILRHTMYLLVNREYLAPHIRSMNNRFHSETKLPWSYDYSLANDIATNKSSANREMSLFSPLYPFLGYLRKNFPAKEF